MEELRGRRRRVGDYKGGVASTCCETKQFKRADLRENAQNRQLGVRTSGWGKGDGAHPGDIVDDAVDDLALERLEHYSAISRDKLCLAVPGHDHALAYVGYRDDGDDEAELAGAGALDVRVELRLEVLLHARAEVGRVRSEERRVGKECVP